MWGQVTAPMTPRVPAHLLLKQLLLPAQLPLVPLLHPPSLAQQPLMAPLQAELLVLLRQAPPLQQQLTRATPTAARLPPRLAARQQQEGMLQVLALLPPPWEAPV